MSDQRSAQLRRSPVRVALALLVAIAPGCDLLDSGPSPADLIDEAKAAASKGRVVECYDRIKSFRTEHPAASRKRQKEAFKIASHCYQRAYMSYRLVVHQALYEDREVGEPVSRWFDAEKEFMYEWLASYMEGERSPREWARILMVGFPVKFYREFKEYQATRPELAHWELTARWDNGIIEEVAAARVEPDRQAQSAAAEKGSEG